MLDMIGTFKRFLTKKKLELCPEKRIMLVVYKKKEKIEKWKLLFSHIYKNDENGHFNRLPTQN